MFLGSRFTHVSRTGGADAGTAAITIREALLADGGVAPGVTLNAWTATMQHRFSRELTWKAHQAACSGDYSLCALLGRDTATQLTNFEPQFDLQTPGMPFSLGVASKSRMRILDGITVSPIITWVERAPSAGLVRVGVNQAMALSSTTGVPEADDVLGLSNGQVIITARCTSRCTFGSQTDMLTTGTLSQFTGRATAPPTANPFTNVQGGFRNEPDFSTSAPIRLGYNGASTVTLAGTGTPGTHLRIEQRTEALSLVTAFVSTNEMRVIDVAQGASSQSVLILAENNRPNTLNGMTVPHSMGNGPNVVLIRVTAGTFLAFTTFDLPGVQQPVGLAGVSAGASNRVFIAVNEGTTAQLWDVPEP